MPYLQLAPRPGNTAGGLLATAAHWLRPGLRIATWVRPPRLTRGAAGVSLSPAPGLGNPARRGCLWDRWDRSLPSLRGMPINGIVGSASRGTSWRTFPCCSLEAGTYLPCWVCSCQGGNCRRFQLNGGKILKDAFRNKLIFDGQRRYYPFKKINLFCRQPMLCGGVFIHKMNTARTSPAGRINRVSKRQFLNVAVDCSTRHIKTFCQLAYLYMPPDAKQFKNLPPAPSGLHGLSPPPSFCSGLSILQNAEKRLPLFPNT